jgi:hypothetical protein
MLLWAFSNSSRRIIVYGFLSTASVSKPPSSYPTYLMDEGEGKEKGGRGEGEGRERGGLG